MLTELCRHIEANGWRAERSEGGSIFPIDVLGTSEAWDATVHGNAGSTWSRVVGLASASAGCHRVKRGTDERQVSLKVWTSQTEPGEGKTDEAHHGLYLSSRRSLESGRFPTQSLQSLLNWQMSEISAAAREFLPPGQCGVTFGTLPKLLDIVLIDSPHCGLNGSL